MKKDRLFISEILKLVGSYPAKEKKIQVLRLYANPTLIAFLHDYFAVKITPALKIPEYRADPAPLGLNPNNLWRQFRSLWMFHENSGTPKANQERALLNLLEGLHPQEAEVLVGFLKKNIKCRGLTRKLVADAFPGIFGDETDNKNESVEVEETPDNDEATTENEEKEEEQENANV